MTKLTLIQEALPSDQFQFGGQPLNQIISILTGTALDNEEDIKINTTFKFFSSKFALYEDDPQPNKIKIVFKVENIDTGGDKTITYRNPTVTDDFAVTEKQIQVLENKILGANTQVSAPLDFNSNPIVEAVIDGDLNTLQDIPDTSLKKITDKAKLPDSTAFENETNIFTAVQTVQVNTTFPITSYRQNPVAGSSNAIAFDHLNADSVRKNWGHINIANQNVTPGAEEGQYRVSMMHLGTISQILEVTGNVTTIGFSPARVSLDTSGITATRINTFPNYAGEFKLGGIVANQHKEGWCDFTNPSLITGGGLLSPLLAYYSTIAQIQGVQGTGLSLTTGTVANTALGWVVILPSGITRRSWNPFLFYRTSLPSLASGDSCFYYGFTTRASLLPSSNSPIGNTESGVFIGYRSFDTEFKVFHNDGSGGVLTVVPISPSVPVPSTATTYSFEIKMTSAGILCSVYNSGSTLLGSVLLSSGAIPATTTNLNLQALLFNPTGVNKAITPTKLYAKSEK